MPEGLEEAHWSRFRRVILFGAAYLVIGLVFSALDAGGVFNQSRAWRLSAWAVSAATFAAHIGYERFRLGKSISSTALDTALGAAVGAFGLAIAATIHALQTATYRPAYLVALALWPVITGVPAFIVALVFAAALARLRRSD